MEERRNMAKVKLEKENIKNCKKGWKEKKNNKRKSIENWSRWKKNIKRNVFWKSKMNKKKEGRKRKKNWQTKLGKKEKKILKTRKQKRKETIKKGIKREFTSFIQHLHSIREWQSKRKTKCDIKHYHFWIYSFCMACACHNKDAFPIAVHTARFTG